MTGISESIFEHLLDKLKDNLTGEEVKIFNRLFSKSELEAKKKFLFWLQLNYKLFNLNQIKNINRNIKLLNSDSSYFIKTIFYDYVIDQFVKKDKVEVFDLLLPELYSRLYWTLASNNSSEQIIEVVEYLCKEFPERHVIDKEYVNCFSRMLPDHDGKVNSMIRSISYKIRTDILYRATDSNLMSNFSLRRLLDSSLDDIGYADYIKSELYDGSDLCNIIKNAGFFATDHVNLKKILLQQKDKCPQTINYLLNSAAKEKLPFLVLELSACFPTKKILQKLIEIGEDNYINKFVNSHPELKDLMVYY